MNLSISIAYFPGGRTVNESSNDCLLFLQNSKFIELNIIHEECNSNEF